MKKISIFLVTCLLGLSVGAQNSAPVLTIQVNGNRNKEVLVDGRSYAVTVNTDVNSNAATAVPITVYDLQPGSHTLQVVRTSYYNNNNYNNNTTTTTDAISFYLRAGYNKLLTVNKDGSIQQTETRNKKKNWNANTQYKTPMSDASFNILLTNAQNEWRTGPRRQIITNAFAGTGNYFTTGQARQLIQLVNSQSSRLQLAKSVYPNITDPANFNQVYDLLSSQSSRNELAAYVAKNSSTGNPGNPYTTYKTPMSDATFMTYYHDVENKWQSGAKMSAAANVFSNINNYYSTSQARQLIQLLPDETSRLNLAKLSYRGITDPANFNQLYDVLNSQSSRNDLAAYVTNYVNGTPVNTMPVYTTPTRMAMSDASFNALYRDVEGRFGLGAKMSALTNTFATTTNYFTTYQARQLIQLVSDETNRLTLAKSAYRNLTDPSNFAQLNDLFASQSSRNELAYYVQTYNANNPGYNGTYNEPSNNTYKTAMSDASFNTLYNDIRLQFGLGVKMSSLTEVFANTSNYFTTAQAKELIKLVSEENNRLQLAKSSYDNVIDPANFTQLYDVLSTQAGRNELAAYVNSYSYNR